MLRYVYVFVDLIMSISLILQDVQRRLRGIYFSVKNCIETSKRFVENITSSGEIGWPLVTPAMLSIC